MSAASTAPEVSVRPGSTELRALLSRVAAGAFAREQEAIAPYESDEQRIAALVLPIAREGLTLEDDWDGIGQRLSATGTTRLENVLVDADEVILRPPAPAPDEPPEPTYIGAFLQLYLTGVIAGVARSVRDDAAALVRGRAALLFDVGGASATKQAHNLDRHWRNVRTLASHNPTLYKARAIGDHVINGAALPQNGFF
jgi:alkylation response protein AidB-like acyl-CoA dehydrogenase